MTGKSRRGGGDIFVSRKILNHVYDSIISCENLLLAWKEFLCGKRKKADVLRFRVGLFDNIYCLHGELKHKTYRHSTYEAFNISDPKPRSIHKARVRDRLLHHAIYRILYPFFDRKFISDSFSCRKNKGTHRALERFTDFARRESKNHTKTVWILKCDIRKFFASIDQAFLLEILQKHIADEELLWLLKNIIKSFNSGIVGRGLPLGNLTSQLLVNIYMNEFDRYVKHKLKAKYYIRYADDFAILSQDRVWLENILLDIRRFLHERLKLDLHPDKVFIKTVASGVDFLGWVHFPYHRVIRTSTKWRMFRTLEEDQRREVVASYLGMLSHGNSRKLVSEILSTVHN